tara:strand:- start:234 stop:596 length:363 start_codon:yes stop_codon:yes gene_type:complete
MGVTGKFLDSNTGLTVKEAYISTYKSNINVSTLADNDIHNMYSIDPSTKPQGWDESFGCHGSGKFEIHAQVKVYTNKKARDNNLREINVLDVTVFCNDTNSIYSCIYDKLKEQYKNLKDC